MEYERDTSGRATNFTDTQGYDYGVTYDDDGYVTTMQYPNGTVTDTEFRADHTIRNRSSEHQR